MIINGYLIPEESESPNKPEDSYSSTYSSCSSNSGGKTDNYQGSKDLERDILIASGHLKDLQLIEDYESGRSENTQGYYKALTDIDNTLTSKGYKVQPNLTRSSLEQRFSDLDKLGSRLKDRK